MVASVDSAEQAQGRAARSLMQLGLAIFFTMNVMVFTIALWSQDLYPDHAFTSEFAKVLRSVFRWASLVFSLPVVWLLGEPIARGVWQALARKAITTDLLILLGVGAAYGFSAISVLRGHGHVYFEVAAMVLVFVSLGRWLEARGKRRTNESLDGLINLLPPTVRRIDVHGVQKEVAREQVVTGDVLRVLPGERLPVDGRILLGEAHVDQQMLTGESRAVEKSCGDLVFSGTMNLDGDLRVEVTAGDGQETVSRLVEMIRTARRLKGPQEILADRVAAWFVPLVCLIAVTAGWRQGELHGFEQGVLTGLAVSLIACPCALGLATPLAVWTALGRAAQSGVLFRSGMVLQQLADIRVACFDKTGTLTTGRPSVKQLWTAEHETNEEILAIASTIATGSNHLLSQAIVDFARQKGIGNSVEVSSTVQTLSGRGLCFDHADLGKVFVGSHRLMEERTFHWPANLIDKLAQCQVAQAVFVGWQGRVRGVFLLSEAIRPEASEAVAACRQHGLELYLLTGDQSQRAEAIGDELAITPHGNQLPADKVAAVEALVARGKVAMIGDGLNDAPALASAHVGVALGCGADVSRDAAGVCLLADDLRRFPWAVELARLTNRIVKQNLFWAFSYNCVGIALAATGQLNPVWAALAMAVSSLLVVVNSLRLSHYSDLLGVDHQSANVHTDQLASYSIPHASQLVATST